MTNLYWIQSSNFGDALNPVLHKAMMGTEPTYSEPDYPGTVLAIGSLAHCAKSGNILWGTGIMDPALPLQCDSTTKALAVRGPLTAWFLRQKGVDISTAVFGDPAVLLPLYFHYRQTQSDYKDLVIPHYADYELASQLPWKNEKVIHITQCDDLLQRIAKARRVFTSSLHALIIAEAYEVPAVWVEFGNKVAGNGFKFLDYYLSTGRWHEPLKISGGEIPYDELYKRSTKPDLNLFWKMQIRLKSVCPFVV